SDFGFREEPTPKDANKFGIWLVNATTRIVIESRSWGYTTRVAIGSFAPATREFENYDLLDLVLASDPSEGRAHQLIETNSQVDLPLLAELLQRYGQSVLRGDFSSFPHLRAIVDKRVYAFNAQRSQA